MNNPFPLFDGNPLPAATLTDTVQANHRRLSAGKGQSKYKNEKVRAMHSRRSGNLLTLLITAMCCAALTPGATLAATPEKASHETAPDLRKQGENLYREGILPSGKRIQVNFKAPGTVFACASCHLRSGIGGVEENVYTPPIHGPVLFKPVKKYHKGVEVRFHESPFLRPAYTEETLAIAIRDGISASGTPLNDVMPRYILADSDMALLITYLKGLSSQFSPGVTDTKLHFASIVSEDANPDDVNDMFAALEKYITDKNNLTRNYQRKTTQRDRLMAKAMSVSRELEPRKLTVSRWVLKGPPETWRQQLEEYNRKEPVFALLGGIVQGEWKPIHQFCEERQIPCLFPNTEFPVISGKDWYTLYISKGLYQEGEGVARYLDSLSGPSKKAPVLEIIRLSREGRTLSAGFEETWRSLEHNAPIKITLKTGETLSAKTLRSLLHKHNPSVVLLWDDAASLSAVKEVAAKFPPAMLFMSSDYLGSDPGKAVPVELRSFTYLAYPYRLPEEKIITPMGDTVQFRVKETKVAQQTYALTQILSMAIMGIKDNYYRDALLDFIGTLMDQVVPLHERLSFGPGHRYASKGCYIIQLDKSAPPGFIRTSSWLSP